MDMKYYKPKHTYPYVKKCTVCGKAFVVESAKDKLKTMCSKECKNARKLENAEKYIQASPALYPEEYARIRKRKVDAAMRPLTEKAVEADRAGMTYGKYIYSLDGPRWDKERHCFEEQRKKGRHEH